MILRFAPIALLLSLAACQPARPPIVPDGMVDVGGRSLHLHCVGEGSPAVVMDAGLGDDGTTWSRVQPEIGRLTRACVYDRAGTGYSDPAPKHHTCRQMSEELHTLLQRAGIAGPYVLVAHSIAGLNLRLFASAHPAEVAGMVLVDTTTEEQYTRYWDLLPPETRGLLEEIQRDNPEGLDHAATVASMADLRANRRSLGDLPLVVLTRGKEDPPPPGVSPELSAKMAQVWREMQAELPRFSSNSTQIIAENSQHHVHWDASRLVVASIQKVVEAARSHGHLDAAALVPLGKLPRENNP